MDWAKSRFSVSIWKSEVEDVAMSNLHKASWLDRWWPLLLVAFGTTFIATLALFHPMQ
jgi:hypothetical protein